MRGKDKIIIEMRVQRRFFLITEELEKNKFRSCSRARSTK